MAPTAAFSKRKLLGKTNKQLLFILDESAEFSPVERKDFYGAEHVLT
ncbi:MAG: hypothetical protein Q8P49_03380 [Candidatus Liptonbacteria bacterium]|nr:hypothetical protein [Candidatus Liptonbacteria bacterium]